MKIDTRKWGCEKNCWALRGCVGGGGEVGLRKFVYFKTNTDIIIRISRFSTQQFNEPVQLSYITWFTDITDVVSVIIITLLFIKKML